MEESSREVQWPPISHYMLCYLRQPFAVEGGRRKGGREEGREGGREEEREEEREGGKEGGERRKIALCSMYKHTLNT